MYVTRLYTRHFGKHDDYIFSSTFATDAAMCVCVGGNCDISSDTPRNSLPSSVSLWGQRDLGWLFRQVSLLQCWVAGNKNGFWPNQQERKPFRGQSSRTSARYFPVSRQPVSVDRQFAAQQLDGRRVALPSGMTVLGTKIPEERPRGKV